MSTTAQSMVEDIAAGTALRTAAQETLSHRELDDPCGLPGWRRRHVLAHLASKAEALRRLMLWARTGAEHRMYASPEQRAGDIERGPQRDAPQCRETGSRCATCRGVTADSGAVADRSRNPS